MRKTLKRWWEGEWIPRKNDPGSPIVFLNGGRHRRHWTAKVARWGVSFYMREWKWTLGAAVAVIGALVFKKF